MNKEQVLKTYSFNKIDNENSHFYCMCGHNFLIPIDNEGEALTQEEMDQVRDLHDILMLSTVDHIKCPNCNKNFTLPEERKKLIQIGDKFWSSYSFDAKKGISISLKRSFYNSYIDKNNSIDTNVCSEKCLEIFLNKPIIEYSVKDKSSKDIWIIDLSEINQFVDDLFENPTSLKLNTEIYNLHIFLSELANLVPDHEKLAFFSEFLSNNTKGVFHHEDDIKKIVKLSIALILYPNLSTIALTKSLTFLYDVINNCELPTLEEMISIRNTKPIDIFNQLSERYLIRAKNEMSEDNNSQTKEFIYKKTQESGEEKSFKIKVRDQKKMDKAMAERTKSFGSGEVGGKSSVMDEIKDGTVTKFIYNNLRNFYDYKQIVKYFKFYSKTEVVNLIKKYGMEYLTNLIDMIYWREKMSSKEFHRIFKLTTDFARGKQNEKYLLLSSESTKELEDENIKLIRAFDFTIYDDCLTMLEGIKINLKRDGQPYDEFERSHKFDKIDRWKDLKAFHDNLATQFSFMESKGGETSYEKYVKKYAWLEEKGEYDGPIEAKLLRTLGEFMREGQLMNSSQGAYGQQVAQEIYLVAMIIDHSDVKKDGEEKRFTIGFSIDRYGFLEFDQLKGYRNSQASDATKKLVMEWMEQKDISFQQVTDLKFKNDGTLSLEEVH